MGFAVLLLLSILLSAFAVRSDYPPPSEEGHSYYSGSISRPGVAGGAGGSFLGDWSSKDWSILSGHNQVKCLDMPSNLTLCRDVGYTQMRLPNLLQHDTLKEVTQQASTWVRLAQIRCHPDTQKFLCSLFAPFCLDQPIWPCKSLCEAVKSGCENKMLKYGFPWPEMLRCDQFPEEPDLCIGIQNEEETADDVGICPACSRTDSYDTILNNLCKANFVMRIKVGESIVVEGDLKIVPLKKKKVFRSDAQQVKTKELREGVLFLDGGASCDCPPLDTVNGRRNEGQLIVAGNRTRDRLVVSLIQAVDQQQGLRRALHDIRQKAGACEAAVPKRTHSGSSARKPGVGAGEGKKNKKKKKDKKTTQALSITSRDIVGPPIDKTTSRGGEKISDVQENPYGSAGQRPQARGKAREARQHTTASPRPPKKPDHKKGQ